ncbi:MAG: hypothetical protein J5647_10190 [Spirochaetaceae bacterium]|nr:hypothetical protein [Spirochaetaceae bacterium]
MNRYDSLSWETMLTRFPAQKIDINDYFHILCPDDDYPAFLDKYIDLPILKRLQGIGLLCGTDWTRLYRNRFYYSRLDHSKGVALIVWHFTHDKAQTVAGLLHDVSTPVFSHVSDFRKGDALTQTSTEEPNALMIRQDEELRQLLTQDSLTPEQVSDYHVYPVADNEIPHLSADRLEYMYPSGLALDGSWTLDEIRYTYGDLAVLKNNDGIDELGFRTVEAAELYCEKFCDIGHILQLNENKLSLHLLGQIMNRAVDCGILHETDFMTLSEKEILEKLEAGFGASSSGNADSLRVLKQLYVTYRTMESIKHTDEPLENHFCVNLNVKMRYIDPLVLSGSSAKPISSVSSKAKKIIDDFLSWHDKPWGCVPLATDK